jgi:hypothetical protein
LRAFAATVSPADRLGIHGYASEEGPPDFNLALSCLRAQKVMEVLDSEGLTFAQIGALYKHGGTSGPRPARRSVVIDKLASSLPPTPAPSPPPAPAPAPAPTCASFPCLGTARCLTTRERTLATSVFGSSLDFNLIRISDSLGAGGAPWTNVSPIVRVGGRPVAPFPGAPVMPIVSVSSGTCLNLGTTFSNATLIHELVHSWQSQHHSDPAKYMWNSAQSQALSLLIHGDRGCAYRYAAGAAFGAYAAEQIAQIVEDHFLGTPGLSAYVSTIQSASVGSISADNVTSLSTSRVGPPPC